MSNILRAILPRPIRSARLNDVQDSPSNVTPKTLHDFERVCEQIGIFEQTKRLKEAMDAGDVDAMAAEMLKAKDFDR